MIDEYEWFRDTLNSIRTFDPNERLAEAANRCFYDMSYENMHAVASLADGSEYGPKLLSRYAAIVLMEEA